MFADKVEIEVKAGKGGDGRLSFRHEKYRAKGGPDGGDGGKGGDVIFKVDHNSNTLSRYRTSRIVKAEDGAQGGDNRKKGKSGEDAYIPVPAGTVVYESSLLSSSGLPAGKAGLTGGSSSPAKEDSRSEAAGTFRSGMTKGVILADLSEDGQEKVIAKGGRGGFGNAHFTASTRQAPRIAEIGEPGQVKKLTLELKLVADVGLVGLPNAGKSTLLSVISNAKPEIADYPFTTLIPNLGVVDIDDDSFLVADIPGLIEGASQGKGLGDEFLRHIERTAVLLHLIDAGSVDPVKDMRTINQELKDYQADLADKPQLIVLSKIDSINSERLKTVMSNIKKALKASKSAAKLFAISAVAHKGTDEVLREVLKLVKPARELRQEQAEQDKIPVIDQLNLPRLRQSDWLIIPEGDAYRLTGDQIEGFARRTDWESQDALQRLRDILLKTGVARELSRLGAPDGAKIKIGDNELEWI